MHKWLLPRTAQLSTVASTASQLNTEQSLGFDCQTVKQSKRGHFSHFGGTKNGTSGARIEILRPLFNTN